MIVLEKKTLRFDALVKRRLLPRSVVNANSVRIQEQLAGFEAYKNAGALLTYVSAKDNEVDTHQSIRHWLGEGKPVFIPVCEYLTRRMRWSRMRSFGELTITSFGLLEPAREWRRFEPVPRNAICLVPGIAFTRAGNRLGFGGGYFDRFLADFSGTTVGLAHAVQLVVDLPVEPHDHPVDYIITEDEIIDCGSEHATA